jgi:hypothetical protein
VILRKIKQIEKSATQMRRTDSRKLVLLVRRSPDDVTGPDARIQFSTP